ncbi:MAG: HAMP domain-containing sensor histidine kinase [Sedimentisphaerales bacterium]
MASITEKRLSLHKRVEVQKYQNEALKSQLVGLQHLANIGTVSHMIAHEMNNLLTPLKSYATFALDNPDDRALTEKALQKVAKNCGRAAKIMESMLALVSGETQEKHNARLLDLIDEIFTCLCRDFAKDGITVEIQIPDDLTIWVVPVQIQQVLMNLILNARDAMLRRGGVLTIRAAETVDTVMIEVADTGEGIDPADLTNIFETFFTTKMGKDSPAEYSGAGIGLAFCKMIINGHEGRISVESKPGHGSTFKIALPKTTVG